MNVIVICYWITFNSAAQIEVSAVCFTTV